MCDSWSPDSPTSTWMVEPAVSEEGEVARREKSGETSSRARHQQDQSALSFHGTASDVTALLALSKAQRMFFSIPVLLLLLLLLLLLSSSSYRLNCKLSIVVLLNTLCFTTPCSLSLSQETLLAHLAHSSNIIPLANHDSLPPSTNRGLPKCLACYEQCFALHEYSLAMKWTSIRN